MFSAIRNLFHFTRKDDFSYLKNLARKNGSFEMLYREGIRITSHFKPIISPKSGQNIGVLTQSEICQIKLLAGNITAINWQIEVPANFAEVPIIDIPNVHDHQITAFQIPGICFYNKLVIVEQSIADIHQCISHAIIVDVTDYLCQPLRTGEIIDIRFALRSRIDGKTYRGGSKDESARQKRQTVTQERPKLDWRDLLRPAKPKRKTAKPTFNVFDLIFPILQRPLGQAFDDVFSFPASLYPLLSREPIMFFTLTCGGTRQLRHKQLVECCG